MQSLQRANSKLNCHYRQEKEGQQVLANSRASQQFPSRRGICTLQDEEMAQRSRQDAITELGQDQVLMASTATFGKCSWDSEGSDKTHFSYCTIGSIYFFSLLVSPQGRGCYPFLQRKAKSMIFKGTVLSGLWEATLIAMVASILVVFSLSFFFSLSLSPVLSLTSPSFPFISLQ